MPKLAIATIGLAIVGISTAAGAKDKLEPRTQAMLACQQIAANEARLQCYDQSMAALKQAIEQGAVELNESKKPGLRDGIVKASGQSGDNRYWIELESGERWNLIPTTSRNHPPQPGSTIKVRRPFIGSGYWISGSDWDESRADYVGRGS